MGCKMSKRARKHKQEEKQAAENIEYDFSTLKRARLQALCKKHKLKANGKNTELVSRLEEHYKDIRRQNLNSSPSPPTADSTPSYASPNSISLHCKEIARPEEKVCSNKWCVVEGIMKTDDETHWREIVLSGGRPMVSNRFGKLILFLLEPSVTVVPRNVRDNLICGSCVRKNEELRSKGFAMTRKQSSRKQGHSDISRNHKENSSDLTRNHLSGSVKRKRMESDAAALKRQRKEPMLSRPLSPANPKVRQSRGEEISLTKKPNHSSTLFQEDSEFARRVEAIISSTIPGSQEERDLVMRAKASPVQHSPTKV